METEVSRPTQTNDKKYIQPTSKMCSPLISINLNDKIAKSAAYCVIYFLSKIYMKYNTDKATSIIELDISRILRC